MLLIIFIMAIVKLSGLLSSISGKLNGSCFQSSVGGLVLKNINKKCVKNTILQNNSQIFIIRLQNYWRNFTNAQRIAWNAYADYQKLKQYNNSNRFINGQQTFIKLNFYRLFYGFSILTAPVYYNPVFPNITPSIEGSAPGNTLSLNNSSPAADFFYILYLSKPIQQSLSNPGSILKMIYNINNGTSNIDITSSYVAIFGREIITDEYLFIKFAVACKHCGLFNVFFQSQIKAG